MYVSNFGVFCRSVIEFECINAYKALSFICVELFDACVSQAF